MRSALSKLTVAFATLLFACSNGAVRGAPPKDAARDANAADATPLEPADGSPAEANSTCEECAGTCAESRCLTTLAQVPSPGAIAVDGTNVYFSSCSASGGSAESVPIGGGTPRVLATGSGCPAGVAVGGSTLYVAGLDGTDVVAVPLTGGPKMTLATAPEPLAGIAVDGTNVYFTTTTALFTVPLAGGTPVMLAHAQATTRPAVDGTNVYFGDPEMGRIWKTNFTGSPLAALVSNQPVVTDLAVAGAEVYFGGAYIVEKVPTAGGPTATVGTASGAPIGDVAADGQSVYMVSLSSIWKLPAAGGGPIGLATDQCNPVQITVDAESAYFTDAGDAGSGCPGTVMKLTPK